MHPKDLPFSIDKLPDIYSHFRTKVENVRSEIAKDPIPTVEVIKPFPQSDRFTDSLNLLDADIMTKMGIKTDVLNPKTAFPFKGGESTGLARVQDYYWGTDEWQSAVKTYKETRNGLIGAAYSTKFSPWLSNGCISPRTVISMLTEYENEKGASNNTYWVWFELL